MGEPNGAPQRRADKAGVRNTSSAQPRATVGCSLVAISYRPAVSGSEPWSIESRGRRRDFLIGRQWGNKLSESRTCNRSNRYCPDLIFDLDEHKNHQTICVI